VDVITLSPATVGYSLVLQCSVTAVRGITSRVDFVWRSGGLILSRINSTSPTVKDTSLIYSLYYGVPHVLNTADDNKQYQCEVMINASPLLMASNSYTLNVMGKYSYKDIVQPKSP